MFTCTERELVLRGRLSCTRAIEALLDPVVVVACLVFAAEICGAHFYKRYLLLAFIAFSVNFPGRPFLTDPGRQLVRKTFVHWAVFGTGLLIFGYASQYTIYFPTNVIFVWLALTPIAQICTRTALRKTLAKLFMLEGRHRSAVVVGCNAAGLRLAENFNSQPLTGIKCVGFFDDRGRERLHGVDHSKLLGNLAQLPHFVRETRIDHIYLALPMASQPRVMKVLDDLTDTTASIFFVPDIFVTDLIQGRVDHVGGMPVFAVRDTPLCGISGLIKRLLDIALSSVLLIALSPLLFVCAIAVRLSSPGPIIFKQCRYGLDGKPIFIFKFRTMTVTEDGDKDYTQVTRNDPRVTKIGTRLRQFSLDELPQLFNVLQGEMSLVGPRPHAVAVNEQYRRLIPSYMVRHKVRPGITGLAQVHGYRGGDDLDSMKKRVAYDLEYLRGWSVGLDFQIIFRTIRILLLHGDSAF